MFEPRPVVAGASVLLVIGALAIWLVGPVSAVPAIILAGILGGTVAGWASNDTVEVLDALQHGGFLGLYASGIGGMVVFAVFLTMDVATMAQEGDAHLLLVASPLAIVLFALEGLVGGYVGSGLRVLFLRSGVSG